MTQSVRQRQSRRVIMPPRVLVEHWIWRGLTALVFAGTIAMLFVRCRDGLSHHPDEYASPKDLAVALRVTVDFLERLAGEHRA